MYSYDVSLCVEWSTESYGERENDRRTSRQNPGAVRDGLGVKGTSPPMPARVAPPAWARPTALWLGLLALQPAPRDYHSQGLSGPLAHSPIRARKGTQTDCARRNPHERNIKNDTIGPTIAPYRLPTTVLAITV